METKCKEAGVEADEAKRGMAAMQSKVRDTSVKLAAELTSKTRTKCFITQA